MRNFRNPHTGIRINEALTLQRSKVDFADMLLTVFGKGAKERKVPFTLELRPVLFRWLSHPKTPASALVFVTRTGGRVSHRNAFREVQLLAKRAGLQAHVHPHLFRHQYAANFIRHGGDIYRLSRLLGHTTVTVTQTYLRSLGVEDLRSGRERLSPLCSSQAD